MATLETAPNSTPPNPATLIQAVDRADSAGALVGAVRALAAARVPEGIETLIKVLGFNNPGAAVAAVDGLVALDRVAVPALLAQLDGYNYGARAWAIRALALIGDPRAVPVLVETARGDFALSVRRAAAKGLGTVAWGELPMAERAAGQVAALDALLLALTDPEWVVRYGAVVGLAGLLAQGTGLSGDDRDRALRILAHHSTQDPEGVIRARAHRARVTLGVA